MAGIDSYVELLVRGGGANGSQVFNDLSPDYRTLTTTGNYISHATSYTKFQSSSIVFSCYGYNYVAAANHTDLAMGTGSFTVDFWVYPLSFANAFDICNKSWRIRILNTGALNIYDSSIGLNFSSTTTLNLSQWSHVALVRNGTTFTFYINGVASGTATNSGTMVVSSNTFKIGPNYNYSTSWVAAIDEFRLSKGIARWTADFTPPTAAYTGSEFAMTAVGGAVIGGAAQIESTLTVVATGGAVAGGDAYEHYSTERLIASGGSIAGGDGIVKIPQLSFVSTGGAVSAGSATILTTVIVMPVGGAIGGGTVDYQTTLMLNPVRHYRGESLVSSISPDSIPDGAGLQCNFGSVVAGKFGNAIFVFSLSASAYLLPNTGNVTFSSVSWWIQRKNTTVLSGMVRNNDSSKIIYIGADHEIKLRVSGVDTATGASITDTAWHHVCIKQGSTTAKLVLFLDGQKVGTEFDIDWSAGMYSFDGGSLGGTNCNIDNVQIYDRILTDEEAVYLAFLADEELPFPMHFEGTGGAVVGGSATWSFGPYAFAVTGVGGSIGGGSADVRLIGLSGPTNHWTFENTVDGVTPSIAAGGENLYSAYRAVTTGKFGNGLDAGVVNDTTSTWVNIPWKSVSMWISRGTSPQSVILSNLAGERKLYADFYSSRIGIFNGTDFLWCDVPLPNDDTWRHIVVTHGRDSDHLFIYVDGVKASSDLYAISFNYFRHITYHLGGTYNRCCLQDNIQVYDRILTQEDVNYLYAAEDDSVTSPRLPLFDAGEMVGGAVSGGIATVVLYNKGMIVSAVGGAVCGSSAEIEFIQIGMEFIASGGAVVGGSGEYPYLFMDGLCPEYYGNANIEIVTTVTVVGYCPEYYGDIQTGYEVFGYCPEYVGSLSIQHTVQLDVVGNCLEYYGDSRLLITQIVDVLGYCPEYVGNSNVDVHVACGVIGYCPEYYGAATIKTTRSVTILGYCPAYFGSSILNSEVDIDDILSFEPYTLNPITVADEGDCPAYICDIQINSGSAEVVLSYVRGH